MRELDVLGGPHVRMWGAVAHHVPEHGKISAEDKTVLRSHLADADPKKLEGLCLGKVQKVL